MGTQASSAHSAIVKLGVSRQVAIPKRLHDRLGLKPGDYLEVAIERNRLVLTPKALVDKRIDEALDDLRNGRMIGPFNDAKSAMRALRKRTR